MERSLLFPLLLVTSSARGVLGEEQLFDSWVPYISPLRKPPIIDMREGKLTVTVTV